MNTTALSVIVSVILVLVLFRNGRDSSPLAYYSCFFVYFGFGPVISHLLSLPIYVGTNVAYVDQVAWLYVLALASLTLIDLIIWAPKRFQIAQGAPIPPNFDRLLVVDVAHFLAGAYGLAMSVYLLGLTPGEGKDVRLAAAGSFHYQFLLIEMVLLSFVVLEPVRRLWKRPAVVNISGAGAYYMVTHERDFLFIVLVILIHWFFIGAIREFRYVIVASAGGAVLGSILFAFRGGTGGLVGFLNQGSLLFVDTYTLTLLNARHVERPDPFWIAFAERDGGGAGYLTRWLSDWFNPNSPGGYGFSLVAESLVILGPPMVPVVFGLLGWLVLFVAKRARTATKPWSLVMSVFLGVQFLYGLRGELSVILLACLYMLLFIVVVRILAPFAGSSSLRGVRLARRHAGRGRGVSGSR